MLIPQLASWPSGEHPLKPSPAVVPAPSPIPRRRAVNDWVVPLVSDRVHAWIGLFVPPAHTD